MDLYQLFLFVFCAGFIVAIALLSKKLGYKLPLVLCILALLISIYFIFTKPNPAVIYEEPVVNALHQMELYLGLLFTLSFFLITFFTYKGKKNMH